MDENYAGEEVEKTTEPAPGSSTSVWGNISAFVERLDDELFKSLQVGVSHRLAASPSTALVILRLNLEPLESKIIPDRSPAKCLL